MKIWEKPKLIVLARNRPEEAVLSFCKHVLLNSGGPGSEVLACRRLIIGAGCSTYCSASLST